MTYVCWKCKKEYKQSELEIEEGVMGVRCPFCGCKVLFKKTPPVAKKVKAI